MKALIFPQHWIGAFLVVLTVPSCAEQHGPADGHVADLGASDTGTHDTATDPTDAGPRPDAGDLNCGINAAEVHYIGTNPDPTPTVDLVLGEGVYCPEIGILASPTEAAELSELPWVQCKISNVAAADYLCRETATLGASGNPLVITQDILDGLCWLAAIAPHDATPACVRPTF